MATTTSTDPWELIRSLPLGRRVRIVDSHGEEWNGSIVPPHDLSAERVIQLKLDNGYNVGVRIAPGDRVELLENLPAIVDAPASSTRTAETIPPGSGWVTLLATGGTIASRVDYLTGGVRPVKEEREILEFYPELAREGRVRVETVFEKLSEDIDPDDWLELAHRVGRAFQEGAQGVVIAHGTDTLGFTAAALSFLLEELPGPVVFVGAQRSPDRPSSDGSLNLSGAVRVARQSGVGEVLVVMHEGLSDQRLAIHRATRVRKMHSSRRDAFQSRNGPPVGFVDRDAVVFERPTKRSSTSGVKIAGPLSHDLALLWFYPGLSPHRAEQFVRGLRGVVLAGTGLGHVSSEHLPWIRAAVKAGVVVAMTTTNVSKEMQILYVYSTGRELLRAGVLYAEDLLPETAYVKLAWVLAHAATPEEVRALMLVDRAGEFAVRHEIRGAA